MKIVSKRFYSFSTQLIVFSNSVIQLFYGIFQEPEMVKVVGMRYEIKPPRLCCLRLAIMRPSGRLSNDFFTIKYHDMPDVIDFLVLRQTYDTALARQWKVGKFTST